MKTSGLRSTVVLYTFLLIGIHSLQAQPATGSQTHHDGRPGPAPAESRLLTAEGKVEISRAGKYGVGGGADERGVVAGDRIRTGLRSRAVVAAGESLPRCG